MSALPTGVSSSDALMLLFSAGALLATSGVPELFLGRRSIVGAHLTTALTLLAALLGTAGALGALGDGTAFIVLPSPLPGFDLVLGADALSGFFALPVFVVGGLGALYGASYRSPRRHLRTGRRLRLGYGLLVASLVFILLARDGFTFLVAWEGMALSNFFLITTDEEEPLVRRAGWIYLLYSHVTILCLFALFVVERQVTGSFAFGVLSADAPEAARTAIFALAVVAFGVKAGAMPLHSWLPAAHASAPSHVSALMSGVVIKMGIYGLMRTLAGVAAPPLAWGIALLALGSVAALFGVVYALAQHDLKRLLAFHSIENIGIILLGLGLALIGASTGRPDWMTLGTVGCLLHVWNHALFKSLLFFGAGSVVHASGSRDLETQGGLARRMPFTAAGFFLGSLAICGLPPLNGFVSELLLYLGMVSAAITPGSAWVALPAPVLAATGALAVACFVKVCGVVFLGTPRSAAARDARESPPLMLAPLAVLGAACVLVGVAPSWVAPALQRTAESWARRPLPALVELAPFGWVSVAAAALLGVAALLVALLAPAVRRASRRQPELPTWDCGYAALSPRVQYTASSFAELVTSRFGWLLRPKVRTPDVDGLFPAPTRFHSHVGDALLDDLLLPATRAALRRAASLRALPQGLLQRYILYIVAALVPLLLWALVGGSAE
jgi:hydrogenase-4 component B